MQADDDGPCGRFQGQTGHTGMNLMVDEVRVD